MASSASGSRRCDHDAVLLPLRDDATKVAFTSSVGTMNSTNQSEIIVVKFTFKWFTTIIIPSADSAIEPQESAT